MPEPRVVVVIPAGPRDDIDDTLASVVRYAGSERILVIDDTQGRGVNFTHDNLTILPATVGSDRITKAHGRLFVNLCAAYRYAIERIEFDLLLRLDADALLIGGGLPEAAWTRFTESPGLGVLGSYRIGPDGRVRDWEPAGWNIRVTSGLRGMRRPKARRVLRKLLADADKYVLGEHVLGAATFYRREILDAMYERGYLELSELASLTIAEDHLFGLVAAATGFETGDFSGPEDPMAVRWKGLPASPADLIRTGKLVTHSVRSWQDMDEREIRDYFASMRN